MTSHINIKLCLLFNTSLTCSFFLNVLNFTDIQIMQISKYTYFISEAVSCVCDTIKPTIYIGT